MLSWNCLYVVEGKLFHFQWNNNNRKFTNVRFKVVVQMLEIIKMRTLHAWIAQALFQTSIKNTLPKLTIHKTFQSKDKVHIIVTRCQQFLLDILCIIQPCSMHLCLILFQYFPYKYELTMNLIPILLIIIQKGTKQVARVNMSWW